MIASSRMPGEPASVSVEEVRRAELARLAAWMVQGRARYAWRGAIPFGVVLALDPSLARAALLGGGLLFLVVLSRLEQRRFLREGYNPAYVLRNAMGMGLLHLILYLSTGALASPLVPAALVFTFGISVVLGPGRERNRFLLFQGVVILILAAAQINGLAQALAPRWLWSDPSLGHSLATAGFLLAALIGLGRAGLGARGTLDRILERVALARQDLLSAHQQQESELSALSGAIAHELKNPLASVKGLAGLLARDVPEGKASERLNVLRREVDRMQGILEEFLNFSRPILPLHIEDVDLAALCQEVAALHEGQARDCKVRLVVSGAGQAPGDARKLLQVLINLVQNALEASPPGATVWLRIEREGARCRVLVEDEGPGVDPALAARIFEPGVTSKARGSGLGLTIAAALARQQGGSLVLEPRAPRGSRATLSLAVADAVGSAA